MLIQSLTSIYPLICLFSLPPSTLPPPAPAADSDAPLISFDSSDPSDVVFDPLEAPSDPRGDPLTRGGPARASLTRTQAFRRESLTRPKRSSFDEPKDDGDSLTSIDALTSDLAGIDLTAPANTNPNSNLNQGVSSNPPPVPAPRQSQTLMQEWSLSSLPRAPTLPLSPAHPAQFPPPRFPPATIPRPASSSFSYNSIRPNTVSGSPFLTGAFTPQTNSFSARPTSHMANMTNMSPRHMTPAMTPMSNAGMATPARQPQPNSNPGSSTGVGKLPDNLFSDFVPQLGKGNSGGASTVAVNNHSSVTTTNTTNTTTQPAAKPANWTTFDWWQLCIS